MIWFIYPDETVPRAYKISYTKDAHKKLREAAEGRKKGIRTYVIIEKNKLKADKADELEIRDRVRFKLVKPQDMLPKEQ